ncbi:MAG: polymorphic toxin-type HINT domain-containing protein [Acutalibacteraceae bacterium]
MIPGVGAIADLANGFWYLSEGDYFSAASSFVSSVPGIGDIAGGIAKGITGCTKISKAIRFATRFTANIGNFALGAYSTATQIYCLWDKYVIKGEPWGDESLGEVFSAALTGVTTAISGKGVVDNVTNYQNTKHDILTSQCFVEGTLVLTIDGEKPIEEIQAGDLVYSTDPETGENEYKEVVQTFENEANELVHITVDDEEITSTPKHPFYVPQKGWTSAVDLKAGDILVLSNGEYVTVEKVQHEILENPVKVYNFEVEDFHTYYVGDNSILVHNQCTTVDNESGSNPNGEAHNVVNYAKYKEVLKTTEEANPLVESLRTTGELPQEYVAKADAMAKG